MNGHSVTRSSQFVVSMSTMKVISLLCLVALVWAEGDTSQKVQTENDLLTGVYKDCVEKDAISCVKYKVYSEVDKVLDNKETITVTEGVQIVKTGEPSGAPRALNSDDTIESAMLTKVKNFIESRSIKIDVSGKDIVSTATSTARSISDTIEYIMDEVADDDEDEDDDDDFEEESRGKKKKFKKVKKIFGPIFGIIALKKAFLIKLLIIGVALLAGKALLVSKLALVLGLIIGIKKLLASKQGQHTEIVATPIHTVSHVSHESHGHGGGYGGDLGGAGYAGEGGHGGWARNAEAQNLAYKGYKAAQESQT